jgi:hypothetical protein
MMAENDQQPQISSKPQQSPVRYTITMEGTRWSVATYGIVEFLRAKRIWRAIVGGLGITCGMLFIFLFFGFKVPWLKESPYVVLFVLTPWLLWLATVSGSSFQLVFPAEQASKERQIAEKKFDESHAPEDALKLDLKRLNEYYVINQGQARSSFRWAVFSMFVGFGTIIVGIWLFYFRVTQPDKFMATLSTAAGCVVNLVSGLFLYLHSKTQDRSLHYYEPLARLQKLSIAIRLVEAHKDAEKQTEARNLVIRELLSNSK